LLKSTIEILSTMMKITLTFLAFLLLLSGTIGAAPALPDQAPSDLAEEAARFASVTGQVDLGGVVCGYLSVDGDLTAIGGYANSFLDEMRKIQPEVPPVNIPALLKITGLDAISALGFSSVATADGFRNKTYVHTPKGRRGLLRLMGGESKPFEVVALAPAGSDLVIEQDLNLKTLYESVLEAAGLAMGEQGKAMVQMTLKQPMPPPITFTMEKVMADLDTKLTVIIDADPTKMMQLPDAPKELKIPQLKGAVLIDGLGWVADELTKVLEPMLAQGGKRKPPFKILRNANWVGMQLDLISASAASEREKKEISELGLETALLAHHVPSGKLVLASGKEFADKLFAPKPGLGQDPAFQKTMKDLPMEGTALSYASPVFFSSLRKVFVKGIAEMDGDHNKDDRFAATSLLNLLLPKNARGEGRVTTNTKDGTLTISNSAHSHKTSLITGVASPVVMMIGAAAYRTNIVLEEMDFQMDFPEAEQIIEEVEHEHRSRPNRDFDKIGD
jgi:hypothetical protein